jgi:hypothetical protein
MKSFSKILFIALFCIPWAVSVPGEKNDQKKPEDPMSSGTFAGLKLRSIGPALTSGRISALAVNPKDRRNYFVAAASGGVWRTVNAGTTFTPVFDGEGSFSIGAVTIDPANPAVVWVGTGENNSQRSVSYGDGVYRSEDGGKSWKNMGLKRSEHIGRICIDPRNSNVVYVAAQGPLWGPGGDRGLFKTTDGGKTWKNILSVSENTGVTDVVLDLKNPDVVVAATYQRRRHVFTLINGGPESGIQRSADGGLTWTKVTSGLPSVDMGRIGLAVSGADSRVIYAIVEAALRKGGVFRSADFGASWEKRNDYDAGAMYFGKIFADPKDVDRIYVMGVLIMVSDDGGKTLRRLGEKSKHVDNHAMWIDPDNTDYYLVGCDGGLYESFDRGLTWAFKANLPITQFYDVTVDNAAPIYNVYGGTQDNSSLGGPSRTHNASGITNYDWFVTTGGDGFQSRVDQEDPNTIYAESQYGGLVRFDKRTGEQMGIQPMEGKGEEPLRWNWDSPLIISPHKHTRLYFAANKLFRSEDRGDSWKAVSGELSRGIDRNTLPVMGKIWSVDAVAKSQSTSFFGNSTALAESPLKEGLLYLGTDDGLIHVTEDGGVTWRKIENFPGIPEMTYVSRILPSQHDVNTVYASFDNHKRSDFSPYILKSADAGRSWSPVKGNLPENGPVLALAEDHVIPNLLFAGTEFGLFFTVDGGTKWVQLKGGLPTIAVRDLAIQKRENDLVLATFGRGFYILDNYAPLRAVSGEALAKDAVLFPVKNALMYIESTPLGGGGKAVQGETFFTAPNPPFGATFTFYLKESFKTLKDKRRDAEKEVEKKGEKVPYPTLEQLRAEDEEEPASIIFTVTDMSGNIVRRLTGSTGKGMSRVSWDLRYPAPELSSPPPPDAEGQPEGGVMVIPGEYMVSVAKRVSGVQTQIAGPERFSVVVEGVSSMPEADRRALVEFQQKAARLERAVSGALQLANDLKSRLGQIKRALQETAAPVESLQAKALSLESRTNQFLRKMRGDMTLRSRNENAPTAISEMVSRILDDERTSTARPTQTHIDAYAIASEEFQAELQNLRKMVEVDLKDLEKGMESAGSPWTPGRMLEWRPE